LLEECNTNSNISLRILQPQKQRYEGNREPTANAKSLNHEEHKEHEEKKNLCALRVLRGSTLWWNCRLSLINNSVIPTIHLRLV
jgi:hypothetical protein